MCLKATNTDVVKHWHRVSYLKNHTTNSSHRKTEKSFQLSLSHDWVLKYVLNKGKCTKRDKSIAKQVDFKKDMFKFAPKN